MKITYETHTLKDELLPFVFALLPIRAKDGPRNILLNWHENIEIIYCVGGKGEVLCGTKFIPIKNGDIVVINSNLFHDIITTDSADCYYLIVENDFCRENGIDLTRITFNEFVDSEKIRNAYQRIIDAYDTSDPFHAAEVRHSVLGLVLSLCKEQTVRVDDTAEDVGIRRISDVIEYIKLHFTERLTLEDIARYCGISRSYLVHEFKKYTKQTVINYLNTLRCINARSLIRNGMDISGAALSSGFESVSYFSKTYKKYMSVCPSEEKIG